MKVATIVILFFNFFAWAETGPRRVCSATGKDKAKIETCVRLLDQNKCGEMGSEQRINCYDPSDLREIDYKTACAQGTWKGIKDSVVGVYELAKKVVVNGQKSISSHSSYMKEVRKNAAISCQADRKVKEAKENANRIASNVGRDALAFEQGLQESNLAYTRCMADEEKKGMNLGFALSLPEYSEVKAMISCLKPEAQIEIGCSIVVPMVLGGVGSVAVKAVVKEAVKIKSMRSVSKIAGLSDKYLDNLTGKNLTEAEIYSLKHQHDLVSLLSNPETNRILKSMGVDVEGLARGILDSDLGKLGSYKKILTEKSPASDQLLNILKGSDQTSAAGKAFSEFFQEHGLGAKRFFNKDLSADEIRQVIKEKPILTGFMHEAPGISEAIEDLNQGRITAQQFKSRLGANLFHNGPQAGFWDQLTDGFVPVALKSDLEKKFFKNTVFEGETSITGLVRPIYPSPVTKEGLVHTMADRLSQGTAGGNIKIFTELGGSKLSDNMAVKIGEMANPFGPGTTNGMNMFRDLLEGNPLQNLKSNPAKTLEQLKALENHARTSTFIAGAEKADYLNLLKSAQNRMLAFHDFMKPPQLEMVKDASGSVEKIILKGPAETGSPYLATIDKNTPVNEAIAGFEKFFAKEELFNGNPLKDLMQPRRLSPSEIAGAALKGTSTAAANDTLHFYCSNEAAIQMARKAYSNETGVSTSTSSRRRDVDAKQ